MKLPLLFAAIATHIILLSPAIAGDEKAQLTPKEIVETIYKQAIPPSGVDYLPLAHERLARMDHFLTPKMRTALKEWVIAKDLVYKNGSEAFGEYDPLTGRQRGNPTYKIKSVSQEKDKSVVVIHEILKYSNRPSDKSQALRKFHFIMDEGRWLLEGIDGVQDFGTAILKFDLLKELEDIKMQNIRRAKRE